jgi:hypothetical protein
MNMAALRRPGPSSLLAATLRPPASLRAAALLLLPLLAGCAGLADQAVPPCPHCGDAQVETVDDGSRHTVHRFRAVEWLSPVVLLQSARDVPAEGGRDAAWAGGESDDVPMGK